MQEFSEREKRQTERFWQTRIISASVLIPAEIVLSCIFINKPIFAAVASGLLVGFTIFLVLSLSGDDVDKNAGCAVGILTAILVYLGRAGLYIWLGVMFGIYALSVGIIIYSFKQSKFDAKD